MKTNNWNNKGYTFDFDDQFDEETYDFAPKISTKAILSVLLSLFITFAILYGKLF